MLLNKYELFQLLQAIPIKNFFLQTRNVFYRNSRKREDEKFPLFSAQGIDETHEG